MACYSGVAMPLTPGYIRRPLSGSSVSPLPIGIGASSGGNLIMGNTKEWRDYIRWNAGRLLVTCAAQRSDCSFSQPHDAAMRGDLHAERSC